jgi:hypothetical protein
MNYNAKELAEIENIQVRAARNLLADKGNQTWTPKDQALHDGFTFTHAHTRTYEVANMNLTPPTQSPKRHTARPCEQAGTHASPSQ